MLAGVFLIAGLATLGLPGLSPFVSEFLVLVGGFSYHWFVGAVAVTGIVWAAVYVLLMYQRTMTGPTLPEIAAMRDLDKREVGAVAPLVLAMVLLGFFPQPLLDVINPAVESTMTYVGVSDDAPDVPADEAAESEEGAR
jgi:NADH-quinone oxidoreductase subunit M